MSPDIRAFIFKYIDSVETLEILLLLRSAKDEWKTSEQISMQLRSNPSSVAKKLKSLKSFGLVAENLKSSNQFKYAPIRSELDKLTQEFAEIYKVKPHRIFELIYSPNRQIREFADAFIIGKTVRKEDDDNG
jgi:predicted transcriptional regulator